MQQTLSGCGFCDSPPGAEMGEAHTWGKDERVTHPICVDCAVQERPDPEEHDHHACDGCGLVVDALAASPALPPAASGTFGPAQLTRFRVELGHLEGPLQLCGRCSPGGPATYWTRDFESHVVE
jgi:hypothetical protein